MTNALATGRSSGRGLLLLLGAAVLVVMQILAYQIWLSYLDEIEAAGKATRNYAAIFEARLDATLRRVDADLKALTKEIPVAALHREAVVRHARTIDTDLDARLDNFQELAGYRVTDALGNVLYTSAAASTARANVSDREYFQQLRDNPKADLVFSEVLTGRTTGRQGMAVARALRGSRGEFVGIAFGFLELDHLQKLFEPLDLGPNGSIALRRSDNQTLVVRKPHLPMEINKPANRQNPIVQRLAAGERRLTLEFAAQVDGVRRIFSVHALRHYPFHFIVGISRDDALAGWRQRAQVAGAASLVLLGLFAGLLLSLWRTRERETKVLGELAQSEELFREMAEGIDQVFFKAAADYSRFDYVSPAFDRIWGHPGAQLLDEPHAWDKWVHVDDRQRLRAFVAENQGRESHTIEFRVVRADGEVRWLQASAFRLAGSSGDDAVVGFHTDITERKQAEDALEESREKYRALSEAAFEAIFISENGVWLEQNSRAEQMFGYSAEEAVGSLGTRFIVPQDRELVMRNIQAGFEEPYEVTALRKDGSTFPSMVRAKMMHYKGRNVRVTSMSDITERKLAEQALRDSEAYNKVLFAGSHIPLAVLDPATGRLVDCNQAAVDIYRMGSRERVLNLTPAEVSAPLQYDGSISAAAAVKHIEAALRDGSHIFEWRHQRPGGEIWDAEVHLMAFQHGGKTLLQFSLQDISERKRVEASLRHSEERFFKAFHSSPIAGSIARASDGCFIDANRNYERDFGWRREELIGRTSVEVRLWPDAATRQPWVETLIREGRVVDWETTWLHRDGAARRISISAETVELHGQSCILAYVIDITERKRAEETIRLREHYQRALLDNFPFMVWLKDTDSRFLAANLVFAQIYGLPGSENVIGKTDFDIVPRDMAERFRADDLAVLQARQPRTVEEEVGNPERGITLWVETYKAPVLDENDVVLGTVGFSRDITARKRADEELRIAATAFESQEGMIITDTGQKILRINSACSQITGYSPTEALGQTPRMFASDRHPAALYDQAWVTILDNDLWKGEVWNRRKNGEIYPVWATLSAVRGMGGEVTHYVASFIDISQRKIAEEEIRHLAFYDPLTHLPNRRLLLDRLRHALIAGARSESPGALLFIDLDNFKALNDTLGHDKGDLLLISVARRLSASVREEDTVARLGGDEFVVMLEGLSRDARDAAREARAVGEKILLALDAPHDLAGFAHHATGSIGIALFAHQADTVDELLKRADLAMYQAKAAGRNTLRFFDPDMQAVAMARAVLEADLREGLQRNQFALHYQPQVGADGVVFGAEALLRWQHPHRGAISPLEFIPLAEETGLILPLGRWVLERACAQLAEWARDPDTARLTLAVNVSARQFRHADFVAQVLAALESSGANPRKLKLELTESMLFEDVEEIIVKMTTLKESGVGFSLDDFGTGYSSLSYLKRLPLDQLKIDQSFVRDVLSDANDAVIARAIVTLGQSMGLTVIAEGVETIQQRDFLAAQGCCNYQGYLFGRPVPAAEFQCGPSRA